MATADQDAGRRSAPRANAGADPEESGTAPDGRTGEPVEAGAPADPVLPGPVRQRVIALVSAVLPDIGPEPLPAALRRVARFAPQRRAKLGGAAIAAQLAADESFRSLVASEVAARSGELGAAVRAGIGPAAADPVDVAALAYLTRPDNWTELVHLASDAVRAAAAGDAAAERVRQLELQTERSRAESVAARAEVARLREQAASLAAEAGHLREQTRQLHRQLRDAEEQQRRTDQLLATEKGRAQRMAVDHDAELRRLNARLARAEAALDDVRQSGREERAANDTRLWLLVETVNRAAQGLRRELALPPPDQMPADRMPADRMPTDRGSSAGRPGPLAGGTARALDADDPARLDDLLALPKAHLVIDGYNVTKSGYGEISLEQQRRRLVSGLGAIAAQTGAEVTVVFDGAGRVVGLPPPPRGVRVLFSSEGETADDLIRRLVSAEPSGRPLVVVSSDREVADGVRPHGAYPLSADTLLRRLSRN